MATVKNYYDNNGNITRTVSAEGLIAETEYDCRNRAVRSVMGNAVTAYTYDREGRILTQTQVGQTGGGKTTVYTYDVFGNVKTVTDNLGQTAYYTYDAAGNLLKTVDRNQTVLYNEYDGMGRVVRSYNTRDAGETRYTYNVFCELIQANDGGRITDYWYDEYNNITVTRTLSGGTAYLVYYEYDENNRLISSNDGRQTTIYAYDANGNMLRSDGEETTDYIFNGAGELAEVWNKGEVYTYEYDHTV